MRVCVVATFILSAASAEYTKDNTPSFLFLLGDDIGWADFGYNNGTALTPNIDKWAKRAGTVVMQDGHSGGTVCSPTRATILTGRNHFRDCVGYVYGCSDMTECEPKFPFAQQRTFTFPDAARAANRGYESMFMGKWHLGSFYNTSEFPSSPLFHGFDRMNATVEVSPTATTNCGCNADWEKTCNFGHYHEHNHCSGGPGPGGSTVKNGCCFNYWWEDPSSKHGVTNLTNPSYDDDSSYLAEAFIGFLESRKGKPFAAQVSFHNCHIPYIGTAAARQQCRDGKTCKSANRHGDSPDNFTDYELDFYACLSEMDGSIGRIMDSLDRLGYYENTFIWFTTDNGPEVNCGPEGFCSDTHYQKAPGDAGPLRGRKRDIWEGGHRVPTIVSWPAVQQGPARESWQTVVTMDFLATIMDALSVDRPAKQKNWGFDGKSIMPILKGESWPERGIGWVYHTWNHQSPFGFRYGKWKYVHGSTSCKNADCNKDLLYDLEADLGEKHDLSSKYPDVLKAIKANFSTWYSSIDKSRSDESLCGAKPSPPGPSPTPPGPAPPPSHGCDWRLDTGLDGKDMMSKSVASKEECCDLCKSTTGCVAADFNTVFVKTGVPNPEGVFADSMEDDLNHLEKAQKCHLKESFSPKTRHDGSIACVPSAFYTV